MQTKTAIRTVSRLWDEMVDSFSPKDPDTITWEEEHRLVNEAEEAFRALCGRVADRFGLDPDDLLNASRFDDWKQDEMRHKAQMASIPWEPWVDDEGNHHHGRVCHEAWDRGLNCQCIPQAERDRIKNALAREADINDVIGEGWGPY